MKTYKLSQSDDLDTLEHTDECHVIASRGLMFPVEFVRSDGDVIYYIDDRGVPGSCHRAEFLRVIRPVSP